MKVIFQNIEREKQEIKAIYLLNNSETCGYSKTCDFLRFELIGLILHRGVKVQYIQYDSSLGRNQSHTCNAVSFLKSQSQDINNVSSNRG